MKNLSVLIVAITLTLSGCDWFNKLDDVNFHSDFTMSYNISVTNDSIKTSQLLSLNSDEEVEKYQNKLKKITVDSVVLQVVDYFSPSSSNNLSGSVLFSETTSNVPLFFGAISNFPIGEGAELKLLPGSSQLNEIQSMLFNKKAIKIYLQGKTTAAANFTLNIYFYVTVEADALK